MKRFIAVAGLVLSLGLMVPALASANFVTGPSLSCYGLSFTYTHWNGEVVTLSWSTGKTETLIPPGTSGVQVVAPPSVPSGTVLSVTGTWPGGGAGFTVSATLSCTPPTPSPPSPPSPPPPAPPSPPHHPAVPPGVPPKKPPHHVKPQHSTRGCVVAKRGQVHVTFGPEGITTGLAYYHAWGPSSVTKIITTIFGSTSGHTWTHVGHGSSVNLALDVTDANVWGTSPQYVGSTYGTHRVLTTFVSKCTRLAVTGQYFNNN
jgi:hypothetical protein